MWSKSNRDIWLWLLVILAVVLNAFLGSFNIQRMKDTEERLQHSRAINESLVLLLSTLKDAETGHRGYLLTANPEYLKPYQEAEATYPGLLRELQSQIAVRPDLQDDLATITRLISEKFEEMNRTIEIRNRDGLTVAAQSMRIGEGKQVMDELRRVIGIAQTEEERTRRERELETVERYRTAHFSTVIGAAMAVAVAILAAFMVRAELRSRTRAHELLAKAKVQTDAALQQVRELADNLERIVQERTAALTASNEDLEKFAYVASHDLQEPLRKIQAFGDRLLTRQLERLDQDGKDSIQRMLGAASRMRVLIDDLLTFSRVSSECRSFRSVNLNEVVAEVRDVFDGRLPANGSISLGELPIVTGDETQLRQLFQNLVGNALKFAKPDAPPEISIAATAFGDIAPGSDPPAPAGNGWRIVVRDNGIGFDQQYAERIFDLFQRLHGRTQFEGTGIGLAIGRKIVQRHGATIVARSHPGEGARFIIDWPSPFPKQLSAKEFNDVEELAAS